MRGVKGYFVGGKDQIASQRHSKEEVTTAIDKLKKQHPSALLTEDDLSAIFGMAHFEEEEDTGECSDLVQWIEDENDGNGL